MLTDSAYELLRQLASPVVAVTSQLQGRPNGMILDSAVRASISPRMPRLSIYVHKWHLSHEYIWNSGLYCLHLLHRGQFGLIHQLGFSSGRERDKMADVPHRYGGLDIPVLDECYAAFECRVVNTMDAGASTMFLAVVVTTHRGPGTNIMTAEYFRANLPEPWREEFAKNYRDAQERIAANSAITANPWPGPTASPASTSPAASR
jgi:flavin reductase (DIM6/NTAB) family NADH-FMN oxidoreductase RutF